MLLFCLILLHNVCFTLPPGIDSGSLHLNIQNIENNKGIIWIGVYDSEANFLVKEKAIILSAPPNQPIIKIPNLPYGKYAIALFHDINHNGDLDRNIVGIPSEPYGFSKPPSSKWRLPSFKEIQFKFNTNNQKINIKLSTWTVF